MAGVVSCLASHRSLAGIGILGPGLANLRSVQAAHVGYTALVCLPVYRSVSLSVCLSVSVRANQKPTSADTSASMRRANRNQDRQKIDPLAPTSINWSQAQSRSAPEPSRGLRLAHTNMIYGSNATPDRSLMNGGVLTSLDVVVKYVPGTNDRSLASDWFTGLWWRSISLSPSSPSLSRQIGS